MVKKRDFNGSDNNGQSKSKVQYGEKRNGRLSQFKNSSATHEAYSDEYTSDKE